jgi:pyridoxine 4-dehydrogenase
VSNFSEDQLREGMRVAPVVSVQNRYNVVDRSSEAMVDLCEQEMLVFLPWAPIEETRTSPAILSARAETNWCCPNNPVAACGMSNGC